MGYQILEGDVLERLAELPDGSVHCVVTSPPYWGLRDYKVAGQIGLEATLAEYIAKMVAVFREVRRVLRSDGTCWVNMGDSYSNDTKWVGKSGGKNNTSANGGYQGQRVRRGADCDPKRGDAAPGQPMQSIPGPLKPKDLVGMPWRLAFALQADGWWLRQDIIWSKPNPMPESVTDRCTKAHEYVFLLTKAAHYYYDAEAIKEDSATNDPRRPYTSQGAWEMDGRPVEQRHGGEPRDSWHGSRFEDGKNLINHPTVGKVRALGEKMEESDATENRSAKGAAFGRGAGWRDDPNTSTMKRNKRCVWEIATEPFPEAHFATFPRKLVEPCILAGTSERGCCAACGAPWVRVVEKSGGTTGKGWNDHQEDGQRGRRKRIADPAGYGGRMQDASHGRHGCEPYKAETTGWRPSCKCGAETVPCTVLDPFSGSGTTGLVAVANRSNYIGIELNPEYAAMSRRRLEEATAQAVLV
jgi:DNA modification methylase